MYHSITFGTKNTWSDWHLIPTTRPVVNPPNVKTRYVEIPGSDGVIDLTTVLCGRPLYENRTGTFEFYVENGFKDWTVLYSEIATYLQGQKIRMALEDDSTYYYEGRFSVNDWKSDAQRSSIVIDYTIEPYKREDTGYFGKWLWDTFNFETGIIRDYQNIRINGSTLVRVIGSAMPTGIIITASSALMTVTFQGNTYSLPKGTATVKEITITAGINNLLFNGNGTVSIEYTGGLL